MRKRLLVTALLATTMFLPTTGVSTAAEAPVVTGAVFNDPKGTTAQQNAVKDHIIKAIDGTQGGRLIRASLYALKDQDYADALIRAHRRGVNIRVVLDHAYADSAAVRSLETELGTDRSVSSWVHVCGTAGACIATGGTNPINHNKFFTFSRIGDVGVAEDVVIQTSANQTSLNVAKYWNNAYTVVGNTALYTAYVDYFNDLAAEKRTDDYYTSAKVGTEKYYFFPQSTGDVVVDILRNVSCTGNSTVGTPTHKSVVRVAAFALHRDSVARALADLADEGCSVQIVYADSNDEATLKGHANLSLKKLDTADGYLVHSKYFTVEGNYAGHPDTKWTFTGSHNLDVSSLRDNDEALLRLEGAAAHDAYVRNFDLLRSYAATVS
ncbi:phosphatidylserine/phosphatidylglycerophosphate/cardiolipin synthase family protein [Streptomyces actuosus]|uniref:phospholipase D n=1 Tax=Streptomyces actuosus TaxID=1885 RepID=A0ABS2VUF2_STRAS|nr:phospholipase D-like domain-containing protein [Streptomyces actuosus]MBN0046750.1 phosphatidylserine/phosphatidylglycerophosphate/cardiolipin synthase family protein [Streptomyces actuosus]